MTDHFATLGLPRRAAPSADAVRTAFQKKGAEAHPDHANATGAREEAAAAFQALNTAQSVLGSTALRLQHLAELLSGERPRGGTLGEAVMGLFGKIGPVLQAADAVLVEAEAAHSALARALLAPKSMAASEALEEISADLAGNWQALEDKLPALDEALQADAAAALPKLAGLAQEAAFLTRWDGQIQQRRLRLAQLG